MHSHYRDVTLCLTKHKLLREKNFAEDIKWAGEEGLASVAEGEISGETCFSRRVDSSQEQTYEKNKICVQLVNNNVLGIFHGTKINNWVFRLQELVVIRSNE